jgi:hypothetical protein
MDRRRACSRPSSRAHGCFSLTLLRFHRNEVRVFNPDRKDHHWGKRKLKRDQ